MTDVRLSQRPDGDLEAALRALAPVVAWPSAGEAHDGRDLAAAVRARIEAAPAPRPATPPTGAGSWSWWRPMWRPARRALVFALVALLALAAIAGAIGLGLPGLRLFIGDEPTVSPPPTVDPSGIPAAGPPGIAMGLGEQVALADLDARAGFHVALPQDPALGPPDVAYVDEDRGGQVSLVWAASADLPATREPGVGLLLSQFEGAVEQGFFTKAIDGDTSVDPVLVGGDRGYWLSGDPHMFFWDGPRGPAHEERRWVGDALLWSDGTVTFRLETTLGRDEAIRLAGTMD
jgi:hypothetical protein